MVLKTFYTIVSGIFQPLFMPAIAFFLLFGVHNYFSIIYNPEFVFRLYIVSFILTIALPILSFWVLFRWGLITDIKMSIRKERVMPTYVAITYYIMFYYLIRQYDGIDPVIFAAFFGAVLAIFIGNIITNYWKISIHGIGISLVTGMFLGACELKFVDHFYILTALFFLIGLVGASRLYLNRHTPLQVLAGSVLGFTIPYLCIQYNWWV